MPSTETTLTSDMPSVMDVVETKRPSVTSTVHTAWSEEFEGDRRRTWGRRGRGRIYCCIGCLLIFALAIGAPLITLTLAIETDLGIPRWSEWKDLSSCSVSCGNGIVEMSRICQGSKLFIALRRLIIKNNRQECQLGLEQKRNESCESRSTCTLCGIQFPDRVSDFGERIISGRPSALTEFPWQAGLVMRNEWQPFCGAVVISRKFAITARHCTAIQFGASFNSNVDVRAEAIEIFVGETDLNRVRRGRTNDDRQMFYDVKKIHNHPRYEFFSLDNDFALLELDRFISDPMIIPICLPSRPSTPSGTTVVTSGWGLTQDENYNSVPRNLQKAELEVVSKPVCSAKYSQVAFITSNMMCAGDPNPLGTKDACNGDSGGPLMALNEETERMELVGVVSFGQGCGKRSVPGVFAKIQAARGWIEGIIGDGN